METALRLGPPGACMAAVPLRSTGRYEGPRYKPDDRSLTFANPFKPQPGPEDSLTSPRSRFGEGVI